MFVLTKFLMSEFATQYSPRKCKSEKDSNNLNCFAISSELPPAQLIIKLHSSSELSSKIILLHSLYGIIVLTKP